MHAHRTFRTPPPCRWLLCLLLQAGVGLWSTAAQAQPRPDRPMDPQPAAAAVGIAAARVERFVLPLPGRPLAVRIQVWRPLGPAPAGGYPVVYMLDGNAVFESLVQTGQVQGIARAVPALIVGIGYDTPQRFDVDARSYDYTPPSPSDDSPLGMPNNPQARGRPGGGADRFLDFIEQAVKPAIAARYSVDAGNQGLYGHSFGGLLVLHALFTRPSAYRSYIAASPSIWWNDRYLLSEAKAFAARGWQGPDRRLLMLAGEKELTGQADDARPAALRDRLQHTPGVTSSYREFPGLGHGQMLPASIGPGLRFALQP